MSRSHSWLVVAAAAVVVAVAVLVAHPARASPLRVHEREDAADLPINVTCHNKPADNPCVTWVPLTSVQKTNPANLLLAAYTWVLGSTLPGGECLLKGDIFPCFASDAGINTFGHHDYQATYISADYCRAWVGGKAYFSRSMYVPQKGAQWQNFKWVLTQDGAGIPANAIRFGTSILARSTMNAPGHCCGKGFTGWATGEPTDCFGHVHFAIQGRPVTTTTFEVAVCDGWSPTTPAPPPTPKPPTPAPPTPAPPTPAPPTPEPPTPAPPTPAPPTPAPPTPAPPTPEPPTPEPLTPAPPTPAPPTPAPPTPEPPTPAPPTPEPPTPEPLTPAPLTPEPPTPEPLTPEPLTPEPLTPEPPTPEPLTPEPPTPAPPTPAPPTPEPLTPEPPTPEPPTPAPPTPEPLTPEPSTPEPSTPEPSTPAPPTPVPTTRSPITPVPPPTRRFANFISFVNTIPSNNSVDVVLTQGPTTHTYTQYAFGQLSGWQNDFDVGLATVEVYENDNGQRGALLLTAELPLTSGPLLLALKGYWPPSAASAIEGIAASFPPVKSGAGTRLINLSPDTTEASMQLDNATVASDVAFTLASVWTPIPATQGTFIITDATSGRSLAHDTLTPPSDQVFSNVLIGLQSVDPASVFAPRVVPMLGAPEEYYLQG